LEKLIADAGLVTRLSACKVAADALPIMAQDATKQWTGTFNPRELDAGDFLELYRRAW
jgi:alcohol dehydrogenase